MKTRIITYLLNQKREKRVKLSDGTLSIEEKWIILHDIKELERHIAVIKLL
ncbi:MAG: hypothetical protein FWC34_00455 [Bacteroidetes bacterium]|nr:hypothetical protein [Bacteroidota bacterium]